MDEGNVKNTSVENWWVATLVERFKFDDEDTNNPRRRCRAFCNVVLIRAESNEEAYNKAIDYGRLGIDEGDKWHAFGRSGKWEFVGIASLLPVMDSFDPDGTEILFDDFHNVSVGRVESWVKNKSDLEVFQVEGSS